MARIAEHYILAAQFVVFYLISGAVSFLLLSVMFGRFCGLGLAAAWGGRRVGFLSFLVLPFLSVAPLCCRSCSSLCLRVVVGLGCSELSPRGRPVLHGFAHCFGGPPDFAAFSELRGARQVERFAASSLDIRRK